MFLRVEKKILELRSGIYIGVVTAMSAAQKHPPWTQMYKRA